MSALYLEPAFFNKVYCKIFLIFSTTYYNMRITKFLLFCIIFLILLITGILLFTKTEMRIAHAAYYKNYEKIYPPHCFIQFENKKYLIEEIYIYEHKILKEYSFVASEGFATEKFNFPLEMNYNKEQKKHFILKYSNNQTSVEFNSQRYKISEKRNDTLISKINDNKLILFIDK